MFKVFATVIIPLSFLTEVALSALLINQTPPHLIRTPEHNESHLDCYHGDNDYPYMLWYQHKGGQKTMELIGYLHYKKPTMEKNFEARFNLIGHSKAKASLVISGVVSSDSAVYYCAASQHSAEHSVPPRTKSSWRGRLGGVTPASNHRLRSLKLEEERMVDRWSSGKPVGTQASREVFLRRCSGRQQNVPVTAISLGEPGRRRSSQLWPNQFRGLLHILVPKDSTEPSPHVTGLLVHRRVQPNN
ncbi:uncharacterized protein LOC117595600 [Esox lucius]|uniref:uncharacterized protein LOC117595600 n=1 Tax=Esox lucius TaxID=8010 RepID=UPI0014777DB8|nr:uncharacterized protein LOC117595600 [Esox lucius]